MGDLIFVLIFAFDSDGRVLLRKKTHPTVQEGAWNGLGGASNHVDDDCLRADFAASGHHHASDVYTLTRKFQEETGLEMPPERFHGSIVVSYPEARLFVHWVNLTDDERDDCYQLANDGTDFFPNGEYNDWVDCDRLNDMASGGGEPLVESTWEYIELIKSIRYKWDEEEKSGH